MAALSEKVLWPIVAIFIFGILAGFYIDDRRRMAQEGTPSQDKQAHQEHGGKQASSEHSGNAADKKQDKQEHGGKSAEKKHSNSEHAGKPAQQMNAESSSSDSDSHGSSSMDMQEYLSHSSQKNSKQLIANAAQHQGFSGSIEDYLAGKKPEQQTQASNMEQSASSPNTESTSSGATSMSMDEYLAKSNGESASAQSQTSSSSAANSDAYHGDIDGYLAKFGGGKPATSKKQNPMAPASNDHKGFHGSYEEYAKQFN